MKIIARRCCPSESAIVTRAAGRAFAAVAISYSFVFAIIFGMHLWGIFR